MQEHLRMPAAYRLLQTAGSHVCIFSVLYLNAKVHQDQGHMQQDQGHMVVQKRSTAQHPDLSMVDLAPCRR